MLNQIHIDRYLCLLFFVLKPKELSKLMILIRRINKRINKMVQLNNSEDTQNEN